MRKLGIFLFLSLYLVLSTIHLLFCYGHNNKARKITKPFLLLSLGLSLCFYVTDYPLIFIACFLACLGDTLLIFEKRPIYFLLGASCFGASHVLNALSQIQIIGHPFTWWMYLLVFLPVPLSGILGYLILKREPFSLFKYAFSMLHIINVIISIAVLVHGEYASGMMILFGYLCCIISDIILAKNLGKEEKTEHNFSIMLTYLIGQLLTYFGLAFGILSVF